MSNRYKKNASANRDALFGAPSTTTSSTSRPPTTTSTTNRNPTSSPDPLFGTAPPPQPKFLSTSTANSTATVTGYRTSNSSISSSSVSTLGSTSTSGSSRRTTNHKPKIILTKTLSGTAKITKMKEAEEYRTKAKKAMQRGMFSKPDPIIAGTYYRRAAEIYKQCGEVRLEKLHRIASADCQRGQDAFSSAAMEYGRAAELVLQSTDEPVERKRKEAYELFKSASEAWMSMGEKGKAGQSLVHAACGLLIGYEDEEEFDRGMDGRALEAFEEAIEAHVPDPLNRFGALRKTTSLYDGEESEEKKLKMALENIVSAPFAHETCLLAVKNLVEFGEYKSALYAQGAVTALLEHENVATIGLSRAYLNETVLQLAIGDVVAADKTFLEVHLQKNSYLASRECKLAEDLIRAIKGMDRDELDKARVENRAAMASLDPVLRELVLDLKVAGVVRKKKAVLERVPEPEPMPMPVPVEENEVDEKESTTPRTGKAKAKKSEEMSKDELAKAMEDNFSEMDQLMGDMGLDGEDDEHDEQEEEELDDDELDLR